MTEKVQRAMDTFRTTLNGDIRHKLQRWDGPYNPEEFPGFLIPLMRVIDTTDLVLMESAAHLTAMRAAAAMLVADVFDRTNNTNS